MFLVRAISRGLMRFFQLKSQERKQQSLKADLQPIAPQVFLFSGPFKFLFRFVGSGFLFTIGNVQKVCCQETLGISD